MKKKEFLFILISSSILVFAWIVFSILESAMSSTISETLQVQTSAIPATFDSKIMNSIKNRKQITPQNIDTRIPDTDTASGSATPNPTVTPIQPSPSIPLPSITSEITP